MCFGTAAFDTEGRPSYPLSISGDMISLCVGQLDFEL